MTWIQMREVKEDERLQAEKGMKCELDRIIQWKRSVWEIH